MGITILLQGWWKWLAISLIAHSNEVNNLFEFATILNKLMMHPTNKQLFSQKDLMTIGEMTRGQIDFLKKHGIIEPYKPNINKFTYYDALKVMILKLLKEKFPLRKALSIISSMSNYAQADHKLYEIITSSEHIVFGDVNDSVMMAIDVSDCHLVEEHTDCIFPVYNIPIPFDQNNLLSYVAPIYLIDSYVINLKSVKKLLDNFCNENLVNYDAKKEYSLLT